VGAVAGTFLWLGLVWIPGRLRPAEGLRAFAKARGALVRGDGRVAPLTVLGQVRGRAFTVTWQRPAGGGDVLLVGVDCAASVAEPLPPVGPAVGTGAPWTEASDAALVTRWVRPAPELTTPERLDALIEAMAELAAELEERHPEPEGIE